MLLPTCSQCGKQTKLRDMAPLVRLRTGPPALACRRCIETFEDRTDPNNGPWLYQQGFAARRQGQDPMRAMALNGDVEPAPARPRAKRPSKPQDRLRRAAARLRQQAAEMPPGALNAAEQAFTELAVSSGADMTAALQAMADAIAAFAQPPPVNAVQQAIAQLAADEVLLVQNEVFMAPATMVKYRAQQAPALPPAHSHCLCVIPTGGA